MSTCLMPFGSARKVERFHFSLPLRAILCFECARVAVSRLSGLLGLGKFWIHTVEVLVERDAVGS